MPDDQSSTINRRNFLKTSVTAAGLAGVGGLGTSAAAAQAPVAPGLRGKPNILIIMTDEERYPPPYESAELAEFRQTYLKTRETLRRTGIEFQRHYTSSIACAPSRTCFFTGHYPSLHGVANTDGSAKGPHDPDMFWLTPDTVPTIGNYFRQAGYRTLYKGKWHISDADLKVPGTRQSLASYDENGNRDPQMEDLYLAAGRLERYGFTGWVGPEPHGTDPMNSASSVRNKRGRDQGIADQTVELLAELDASADETPWLMVCSLLDPHDIATYGFFTRLGSGEQGAWDYSIEDAVPHDLFDPRFQLSRADTLRRKPRCQRSYWQTYRKSFQPALASGDYYRLYYQLHKNVDEQMGRVYEQLRRTRFFDNTIIVFTSDHGDLLGAHGGLHQKWYTAYDEALRVPLIISHPGWHRNAGATDMLTTHVDILPTLLGLAGLDGERLRRQMESDFSDAQAPVGKDISAVVRGRVAPEMLDEPIYFMSDDDPSRGLNQENLIGLSYASVAQPNHVETVVARYNGALWKYSRYFDNPQYWTSPGIPGERGVEDSVAQQIGPRNHPGVYPVAFRKQVKVAPEPDEFELYNLSDDPMELDNLAGRERAESVEARLRELLAQQRAVKRLGPLSGTVPGQQGSGDGTVDKPTRLNHRHIEAGTRLDHAVIGLGTTFGANVHLGPQVRFTQDATIPAGLVLTHALGRIPWLGSSVLDAVDLSRDVVIGSDDSELPGILQAIRNLPDYEPAGNELWQDAATGAITIVTPDSVSVVLPVEVFQAERSQAPGTYVTEDGDILFVTQDGRAVLAHPLLADLPAMTQAAQGMAHHVEFDEQANVVLYSQHGDQYFIGRPFSATAAPAGAGEGLASDTVPNLPDVYEHSIIFAESDSKLMQQPLVPRPADWPGLKAALLAMPDINAARIDAHGVIHVKFTDGSALEARADYQVDMGSRANATGQIAVEQAGDLNGNGMPDFRVIYPNGDTQLIHTYAPR